MLCDDEEMDATCATPSGLGRCHTMSVDPITRDWRFKAGFLAKFVLHTLCNFSRKFFVARTSPFLCKKQLTLFTGRGCRG